MSKPEDDPKGQYAPSQADKKASGVHSPKPTVVTGSLDVTVNRTPPVQKLTKNFDLNDDPTETSGKQKNSQKNGPVYISTRPTPLCQAGKARAIKRGYTCLTGLPGLGIVWSTLSSRLPGA